MQPIPLTETDITTALKTLPDWQLTDNTIAKVFTFPDFAEALAFVNQVGALAEAANHHPDITLSWGKVTISLSTHELKAVSQKDIDLAQQIENISVK